MELRHFSHQHSLILHEELKENGDRDIACYGCDKPIMGPNYSCSRDCNYFLHSKCAELPGGMQHWLHPKHPLTLIQKQVCLCDACGYPVRNLTYNCSLCNFNLDLRCISLPLTIQHCGHEHPFTLLTKRAKFYCDACGEEGEGMSYLCTTCRFWVHLGCASLLCIIKLSDHAHPLTLTYFLEVQGDDDSRECRICDEEVKTDNWAYHCADCSFLAHIGCTTSRRRNPGKLMTKRGGGSGRQTVSDTEKERTDLSASLPRTVLHCGHEHPLSLVLNNTESLCDACGSQRKGSSSYICTTCQFWVHLECASLPKDIILEDHDHLFTLTFTLELYDLNDCAFCHEAVDDDQCWVYYCPDCLYVAHVHCAKEIIRNAGVTLLLKDDNHKDPDSGLVPVPNESVDLITNVGCSYLAPVGCITTDTGKFMRVRVRGRVREKQTDTETESETDTASEPEAHTEVEAEAEAGSNDHSLPNLDIGPSTDSSWRKIVHWGHKHPLSLRMNDFVSCAACDTKGELSFYTCSKCDFWVHSECALLPKSFKVADKGHLLSLICSFKPKDYDGCAFCHKKVNTNSWVYNCSNCHCVFHVVCLKGIIRNDGIMLLPNDDHEEEPHDSSLMPVPDESIDLMTSIDVEKSMNLGEETVVREFKHFSHPHCLTLCEDMENDGKCHGCAEPLSGPAYTCTKCMYFLHKSCAELPREILKHPMHLQHPLVLLVNPPYRNGYCLCSACDHLVRHFVYHCSLCKFNLDLRCVSLTSRIQHHGHEHPLTLLPKRSKYTCYACGTRGACYSYLCTACLVLFHSECASSPSTIKLGNHNHFLKLSFSLNCNHPNEYSCVVCDERVKLDHWYYFCEEFYCYGAAHLRCATSKKRAYRNAWIGYDDDDQYPRPILDESIFLITEDVKKNCAGEETIAKELSHFSHQHCLTLCTGELKTGEKCNGCTQPISSQFYSCSDCNFSLHKSCTELRSEIRHPLHLEHRLKLLARPPNSDGLFLCKICETPCNGFVYSCEYCTFEIDIVCSSILGNIEHETHEHLLTLSEKYHSGPCGACDQPTPLTALRCSVCDFQLHVGCAALPETVWHKIHRHPFTLTFHPVEEDDSGEYYCDICEEERNPKHWSYYCADCKYPAHVSCMVGRFQRIKLEVSLKIEGHQHSVTVVEKKSEDDYDIAFHCGECNIDINPNLKYQKINNIF